MKTKELSNFEMSMSVKGNFGIVIAEMFTKHLNFCFSVTPFYKIIKFWKGQINK